MWKSLLTIWHKDSLPPGWRSEIFKCFLILKLLSWLIPRSDRHNTLLSICVLFFQLPSFWKRPITTFSGSEAHPCYWSHGSNPRGMLKVKHTSGIRNLIPLLVWGQNHQATVSHMASFCLLGWPPQRPEKKWSLPLFPDNASWLQCSLVIYYFPVSRIHVYLCGVQKYPATVIANDHLC